MVMVVGNVEAVLVVVTKTVMNVMVLVKSMVNLVDLVMVEK
jgi:hypothetical protein